MVLFGSLWFFFVLFGSPSFSLVLFGSFCFFLVSSGSFYFCVCFLLVLFGFFLVLFSPFWVCCSLGFFWFFLAIFFSFRVFWFFFWFFLDFLVLLSVQSCSWLIFVNILPNNHIVIYRNHRLEGIPLYIINFGTKKLCRYGGTPPPPLRTDSAKKFATF